MTASIKILVALAAFLTSVQAIHFLTAFPALVDTRLDPVRSAGKAASHVHRIVGDSSLAESVTYEDLRNADCAGAEVADDKSLYWQPTLYYQWKNGTFQALQPTWGLKVYWFSRKHSSETFTDIPGGLRMITGDPNKRTMNDTTDSEDSYNTMIGYCAGGAQCVGGSPTLHAFEDLKQYKPDVVRLQTYFPSCWNGVDLDSLDHMSHVMHWPTSSPCPNGFKRIPTTFLEGEYGVGDIPWTTEGALTLSNGDQTGYSVHGDFISGWSEGDGSGNSLLSRAMVECTTMDGAAKDCPLLELKKAGECSPLRVVQEDVGHKNLLSKLPGNNPVWTAAEGKPILAYTETSAIVDFADWAYGKDAKPNQAPIPGPSPNGTIAPVDSSAAASTLSSSSASTTSLTVSTGLSSISDILASSVANSASTSDPVLSSSSAATVTSAIASAVHTSSTVAASAISPASSANTVKTSRTHRWSRPTSKVVIGNQAVAIQTGISASALPAQTARACGAKRRRSFGAVN